MRHSCDIRNSKSLSLPANKGYGGFRCKQVHYLAFFHYYRTTVMPSQLETQFRQG